METVPTRPAVLVPFVCPICAAPNAVALIQLSRAGGMDCAGCKKHLRSADVMRAMHSPRPARSALPPSRVAQEKREMVWPPTAASRAAIAPSARRRGDGMR